MSWSLPLSRAASVLRWPLGDWLDLAVALVELGRARARIARKATVAVRAMAGGDADSDADVELCGRIARALGRAHRILPSTCLVQAIAAQRWLARSGIASDLRIGVRKKANEAIDAHAWLIAGGRVIVGGDVAGYAMLAG